MGSLHFDRWPAEDWRRAAPTVASMRAAKWEVISYCRTCYLTMAVDLDLIQRVSGPKTVLWNRQLRCRRIGCDGVVEFHGKPAQLTRFFRLFADWPA